MSKYYFTFGYGQGHDNCYTVIEAEDWDSARDEMFREYGRKWSMQYTENDWYKRYGDLTCAEKVCFMSVSDIPVSSPDTLISQAEIYNLRRI